MEERKWVSNYVPGSSAREIVRWLLETRERENQITPDQFAERLSQYKRETGLKDIDLLQLREYAEFESGLVSSRIEDPRRVVRHQIAVMARNMAVEQGALL